MPQRLTRDEMIRMLGGINPMILLEAMASVALSHDPEAQTYTVDGVAPVDEVRLPE